MNDDEREKRERFTDTEIQTGAVAVAGLERLYASLEERGGRHDDRLILAILNVKAMFQDVPALPADEPFDDDARRKAIAQIHQLALGVADLAKQVGDLIGEMKRFL